MWLFSNSDLIYFMKKFLIMLVQKTYNKLRKRHKMEFATRCFIEQSGKSHSFVSSFLTFIYYELLESMISYINNYYDYIG